MYTLVLSLNLSASSNFAEEIFDFDFGVSLEIIPMARVVLVQVVVPSLLSILSAMNCQNLFPDFSSLSLTNSSNFVLDTTAHFSNLSTSEYQTENPIRCNTSTRGGDLNTL